MKRAIKKPTTSTSKSVNTSTGVDTAAEDFRLAEMERARGSLPITVREHAATLAKVIRNWREISSDMHSSSSSAADTIEAATFDDWIEKLDALLKMTRDSTSNVIAKMWTAGYSRPIEIAEVDLGQWLAP